MTSSFPGSRTPRQQAHTALHLHQPLAGRLRPESVRVAIVDLDRRVQVALAEALRAAGLDVVGTAGDLDEALRLVALGAQVLVVDPRLPDLSDGHALVETVVREWPSVRVVIMGWGDAGDSHLHLDTAAFVTKSARPEEFVAATLAACGC